MMGDISSAIVLQPFADYSGGLIYLLEINANGVLFDYASESITFKATDAMAANRFYDGRLESPGSFQMSISLSSADGASAIPALTAMSLGNGDGALDGLPDVVGFVNGKAVLKVGERGSLYSTYVTLITGVITGADVGLEVMDLQLTAAATGMAQPWFEATYAGTGLVEGPASLTGVRKPYVMGRVFNISPILIEPLTYIFQAHGGGALAAVQAVRFGGSPLTFTANFATYAALAAAVVNIGEYATCRAEGLIKAGLTQAGAEGAFRLTADVSVATVRATLIAADIAALALANHGVPYDAASFTALDAALPADCTYGRYITEPLTYADVMGDVMANLNAYWGSNRAGQTAVGYLKAPADIAVTAIEFGPPDIIDIDRLSLPEGFQWPWAQLSVRFDKNWTLATTLAAIVNDPALSQEYKETFRLALAPVVGSLTPPALTTNLRFTAAGVALVQRMLALHGVKRFMYSVNVSLLAGLPGVGEKVRVVYPRFGLTAGKDLVVVASTEDYTAGTVLLTLWG